MTNDTTPAALVWRAILAQVRELGVRAIIVGATRAAGSFVFRAEGGEADGCAAARASNEICNTQPNKRKKPILFTNTPFQKKNRQEK